MGAETEIITHTVTVADATVSKFGFGVGLIAGFHNYWLEDVKTFQSADDMTKAPYNMPTTDAIYKTAVKLKSQSPSPPLFKVGKLTGSFTQVLHVTPMTPTQGMVFSYIINGKLVTYTALAAPTVATVLAGLQAALTAAAVTGITGTVDATKQILTATVPGAVHDLSQPSITVTIADATPISATTPATDLARIRGVDGDWYGLIVLAPGKAAIASVAAWAETQRVIYLAASQDGDIQTSSSADIASTLSIAAYHRSAIMAHPNGDEHADSAWLGRMLPALPGPITFANKGLAGVSRQNWSSSARGYMKAKKSNYYVDIKGLGFTLYGWASSGRFIDVTVAVDWFSVGIEDRIILLMRNNDVVPYTDKGIELVRSQVVGQIQQGIALGIIDGDQPWSVTAPSVATVDPASKAARILPDIKYVYTLSGAIQSVIIVGTVKV
jgi:hypothetical protein